MNISSNPVESDVCDHLIEISQMISQSRDWKKTLDDALPLIRPMLIFDNLVIYTTRGTPPILEVIYARALGRGKSMEADIAWGESLASKVFNKCTHMLESPPPDQDTDRLASPYLFGIPLTDNQACIGVLILIRYGGPIFTRRDERLGNFLASQIEILIQREALQHQVEILEILRQQAMLQDSFVSMISHELRHPLGFIKGYVTTLLRKEIEWDSKTQMEFLQIIDQETDQLLEIIDNMLDSARLQSGNLHLEFQPVRLDSLLEGVVTQARNHFPQTTIHLTSISGLPAITGDPRRLGQVFYNLINNANKYAPGSDIWVTISKAPVTEELQGLLVQVKDKGPGIPAEYLPHIFERFFRNPDQDPNIHGSGLGLYICKQIIEAHNGTITAESTLGAGTAILVFLPYPKTD